MSVQVKHRRDTAANIATFTPAQGELIVDTTNNRVIVGDGATAGGFAAAKLSEVASAPTRTAVSDANYTGLSTDRNVAYTAITAARVVTLPSAASFPTGVRLTVFDESGSASASNTITVTRAGSDTINGGSAAVVSSAYGVLAIETNGSNKWTVIDQASSNLSAVGVGTAADPSNPLSVYGSSALFNGTSFSFTLNKSAAGNTASVLFQEAFSARAQIGLIGDDNFNFKVSPNGSTYYVGLTLDKSTGAVTLGNARTAVADANYTALATDREVAYTSLTAARTVTLPAASAFPAGHPLVIIDESGSVSLTNTITVSRAGSDTISSQTSAKIVTAYGHIRLVSNGSNAWVVAGRSCNIQVFSSSVTYTPSAGLVRADVYLQGGGGGGGGGALQAASTAVAGGGGGGGGHFAIASFPATALGASQTVTLGAAGAAGTAASAANTAGGSGGAGGNSSFGSLLTAYGAGGGAGGQLATASGGGGGGGIFGAGANATGSSGGNAGSLGGSNGGAGASSNSVATPGGTGGGGCSATGVSFAAGNAAFSATGGGSGAGITAANAVAAGGSSGNAGVPSTSAAGGGTGSPGAAGTTPTLSGRDFSRFVGSGGGGGGSHLTIAGAGGAAGSGGGGGGGGSAQNGGAAGMGGAGGAGYCVVVENF